MRVLVVEDDAQLGDGVRTVLRQEGYAVDWAQDGEEADVALRVEPYDIVVLDLGLPLMDGLTVLQNLRGRGSDVPVLVLTARDTTADRVTGLDKGADDYLVKPFALKELALRLNALTRRSTQMKSGKQLQVGDLHYDVMTQSVRRGEQELALTATSKKILELLMRNAHRVVTKQELEQSVWGDSLQSGDVLRIHIHTLREAIDKPFDKALLHTIRGVGYRLCTGDEEAR